MNGPAEISEPLAAICTALGISKNYVARIEIGPMVAWVDLYKGSEGRCKGHLYAIDENGDPCYETGLARVAPAMETLAFEVQT